MALIEVDNAVKRFRVRRGTRILVGRGGMADWMRGRTQETFAALDGVSLSIEAGEAVGIIGRNGSGKSTLLKLIAGVSTPTSGHVTVRGKVASLLELGAGFHPMLTGRENIYLNAGLLGMRHKAVDAVFDEIVAFSGIGDFIDNPVDTYSSGMFVRLGFSVAVHSNPDLFLVDEVLSVGDEEFQRKCRRRIGELREQGKTIVFVSHDLNIVNTLCERVVLLNRGRMVVRPTPQQTIDYYLRLVGEEKGTHTLSVDNCEVLFNAGRMALYRNQQEVTSASGLRVELQCMGQFMHSVSADWRVVDAGPNHFRAEGAMNKLPVRHHWDVRVEGGRLVWKVALDCEREVPLTALRIHAFLPPDYDRWVHGTSEGRFPAQLPQDLHWTRITPVEVGVEETAALPRPESGYPPIVGRVVDPALPALMRWDNTDYVTGARVLAVDIDIPETQATLPAGRHDFAEFQLDFGLDERDAVAAARRRIEEQTLRGGGVEARFDRGSVLLSKDGTPLSRFVHLYASMLVSGIWVDSTNLRWDWVRRADGGIEAYGAARRFAFAQRWRLRLGEAGVEVEVDLECEEPLEVQEYHLSVGLVAGYTRWRSDHEEGAYPEFDPGQLDWVHVNRDYRPGRWLEALSPDLPTVRLETLAEDPPFRMTAINAGYHQQTRVLQALRTPEHQTIRFEPRRHPYFRGRLVVKD